MTRRFVRLLRRLALAATLGVAALGLLLRRDGLEALDGVLITLLLAPPAIVLFFAQGVRELLALLERLRDLPGEGQQRVGELTRIAGDLRGARGRAVPLALWRLRGAIGSARDVAGVALPLRVLTPQFIGATAIAALLCAALTGAGVIALLVLAAG